MLRLRLRVERNELPAVTTIWPVAEVETQHTIAQLLEKVNSRFPLESEHWGLEHYKVCVGGYECLHYHELGAVCRDEDEVVIRPLQTAEVRARTLLGRDRITMDGRHLLDGVPFGRPLLREPLRAQIRIPPPKRQKLEHHTGDDWDQDIVDVDEGNEGAEIDVGEDEDDDESDDSFRDDDDEDEQEQDDLTDGEKEPRQIEAGSVENDDSASDSSSEVSSSSDEDSDNDSNASDAPSWNGIDSPEKTASTGGVRNENQEDAEKRVPPGNGKARTKDRNQRRRDQRRLNWLKANGHLPKDANLTALAEYEDRRPASNGAQSKGHVNNRGSGEDELERRRQELLSQLASGGIDVTNHNHTSNAIEDDELPEEHSTKASAKTSSGIAEGPPSIRRNRLDVAGTKRLLFGSLGVRVPKSQQDKDALQKKLAGRVGRNETGVAATAKPRENKQSTGPSAVPAEEEDPEAWRENIDLRAVECVDEGVTYSTPPFPFYQRWDPQQRKKKNRASDTYMSSGKRRKTGLGSGDFVETYDKYNQSGGSDALDYDDGEEYWEEGALMGDEEVEEDEDPASQQLLQETQQGAVRDPVAEGRRVRFEYIPAGRTQSEMEDDLLDQEFSVNDISDDKEPGEKDHCLYDFKTASEARRAARIFGSLYKAVPVSGAKNDADFPPIPQELPRDMISFEEAGVNDFLVYRELAVSAGTNWQPAFVLRTVRLVKWNNEEQMWAVARPLRDQAQAEYDDDGNRVYQKFEMEGYEDEDFSDLMSWEQLADENGLGHVLRDWED